jgi:hypothetical protein
MAKMPKYGHAAPRHFARFCDKFGRSRAFAALAHACARC